MIIGAHPQHHNLMRQRHKHELWWAVSFIPLDLKACSMVDTESAC
jgi:hypothetical protein